MVFVSCIMIYVTIVFAIDFGTIFFHRNRQQKRNKSRKLLFLGIFPIGFQRFSKLK